MKKNRKTVKTALIAAALAVASVFAFVFSNSGLIINEIYAEVADEENGTAINTDVTSDNTELNQTEEAAAIPTLVTINSSQDLIDYSGAYSSNPSAYQNIDVNFAITSGDLSNLDGFSSIGTSAYPFAAKLIIATSTDLSITLDKPLFAYITDSAKMVDSAGRTSSITMIRSGSADSALFAENVVHDISAAAPAEWSIDIGGYTDENSFAAVLGTLGENSAVSLTIQNDLTTEASVVSSGDAGLACRKMASNASLAVSLSGTNAAYSVTSESGNAGGLVGTMESGSEFTLNSLINFTGEVNSGSYAGGLVGYAENASVDFAGSAMVSGNISGGLATGGIFGYYKNTNENNSFDVTGYNVNCTLNGDNAGGIFGKLENSGNMIISGSGSDSISSSKTSSAKYDMGGIIGTYNSGSTYNSLTISGITAAFDNQSSAAKSYGGVIGWVDDDSYIKFENVTVSASGCSTDVTAFGGLVGYADKAFIDAENITIGTNGEYRGGGIIGNMNGGVLRLNGTTDISGSMAAKGGQIVGTRGNTALIYAKSGWMLIRSSVPVAFDDIGSWGSVLRLVPSLNESDVFTVNETAHTVTLKGASTSVNGLADFVKLALNIQLNNGTSPNNTLFFENISNNSSVLLRSNISINTNIDLTGTGLTGLTRDDGKAAGGGTCIPYTGTFNGNGHTITLAAGEPYGYRGNSTNAITADDASDGNGCIHRHYYNAMFARTGDGVKFCNVTVDGIINAVCKDNSNYFFGGLAGGHANGSVTAENVTVQEKIKIAGITGNYYFAGGFIGKTLENSNPAIELSSCVFSPEISYEQSNCKCICGGAFGEITVTSSFTAAADNITIGGSITNYSTANLKRTGGFIGNISNYNGTTGARTFSITNMTIDGAKIASASGGALLGEVWNDTEVTIGSETENGITVRNSTVSHSKNGNFAGLMSAASGYWKVYDINIDSIDVDGSTASSFGMLVNSGVCEDNSTTYALYLELENENAYKITSADLSGLNTNAVYDDIIATCTGSCNKDDSVLQNGKSAVVSIHTGGGKVKMNGTSCNTYQDQTSVKKENPNTRYYYNLDVIRAKNSSELNSSEKLMLWSLNKYAYENIKKYFPDMFGNTIPAGSYDMTGYSYYPIDVPSNVIIEGGSTFAFCSDKLESSENGTGNSDNRSRTAVTEGTQHFLMHFGLFRNAENGFEAGSGLTFKGSVGGNSSYSGALVCGALIGSNTDTVKVSVGGVILDGISVNGDTSQTGYAPLLINRIDSYSELSLSNVSTTESYRTNGTVIAATSLIGDVGSSDGTSSDIKLTFSGLTLDGRKSAVSDSAANSSLSAVYKTDRSIFSKAVLINSFKFKSGSNCSGSYNFRFDEDWNEDHIAKHKVAYGSEISDSAEYDGMQEKYIKSEIFTDPTNPAPAGEYTFKTSFLPYVAAAYSATDNFHEIKVNHSAQAELNTGCGTYNDPYIISYGKQLELLDKILSGNMGASEDGTVINYKKDNYKVWCAERNSHQVLSWNSASGLFVSEGGDISVTLADMQDALATAYFKLSENVSITSGEFNGIGKKVPFKGVIYGNNKTIINGSAKPLIYQSIGAVVKDLTVEISADFSDQLDGAASTKYETDSTGTTEFYGGVIGIVNGGDNIIDNVGVSFTNGSSINIKNGIYYGNKAVGGYIGVVRYGGVIFRNMDSVAPELRQGITSTINTMFKSTGDFKDSSNKVLLYCNPIIGRVIDGYAVTETDLFKGKEADVTMRNGTKNYSIADIDKNAERLTFSSFEHPTGKSSINSGTFYVNDAQQLFLLGCIAMSGEGSASSDGKYPNSYSCGKGQMVRHAEYSEIGTDRTADFNIAVTDSFANDCVPYVIYRYTAQNVTGANGGTMSYPAKSITNDSFVFNIELTQGTYSMPDGFRGIGSMSSSATNLAMFINGIKGNSSIIDLNMSFNMYKWDYDKYYTDNVNTMKNYKVGLGLFNTLIQNKSSVTPSGFEEDTSGKYTISDLTISGTVDHEVYKDEGGTDGHNEKSYFSCAGGLAGASVTSCLMMDNVKMSALSVNSRYVSGGLIGAVTGSSSENKVIITNFGANELNVGGGALSGGLIAYARDVVFEADGNTNGGNHSSFRIGSVSSKYSTNSWDDDMGVGGLLGTIHNQNNKINSSVSIKNVDLKGKSVLAGSSNSLAFVGGIIGCCGYKDNKMSFVNITGVKVIDVDINKDSPRNGYCGGIIGAIKKSVLKTELDDVHLKGIEGGRYVEGKSQAGGLVGLVIMDLSVNNCSVENYTIRSKGTDIKVEGIGGFVAKAENAATIYIRNSIVSSCDLQCNVKMQVGGIAGSVVDNAKVKGYNIAVDNVHISTPTGGELTSSISGDIAGLLNAGSELKLVGLCLQRDPNGGSIGKDVGTNNGTVLTIFSDHNAVCLNETAANKEASSVNNNNAVDDMGAYPYATVNSKNTIDSIEVNPKFLTGDGADKSAIEDILSDFGTVNGYNNAADEYTNIFSKYESKLSTFNEKTGAAIPNDIPVLVINDSDYRSVTEMLNSYIHILTNDVTVSNYAQADSSICSVDILPLRLNEESGVFETGEGFAKTLYCKNGYFRMTDMDYDSNYKQFSLIDIQYFDPYTADKTAYHLYIPVYVEKMLDFDFRAAALSGTTYNAEAYTDGHPVLENYGNPITAHVTYSYKRTADEWQNVINSGENLLSGYGKSVLLKSKNDLPADTKLVLVDRNNYCRAYYSTIGEAFSSSDKTLDFGSFKASDGTQFVSVSFCDLLKKSADISTSEDANGMLVKCTADDVSMAVIEIGGESYRKKNDSDGDTTVLYSVQLTPKANMVDMSTGFLKVEEDYYISFFTKTDNEAPMRNITLTCSKRLGDAYMTPSHLDNENTKESMVHMILGNLYDQEFSFKTTGSEVINDSNRSLIAQLNTVISLKQENAVEVKPYLNDDSIHLYHGFIIEATRSDETATEKGVKGNPRISGTYKIGAVEYPQNFTNTGSEIFLSGDPSDDAADIKKLLINNNSVTISCDDLIITYADEEGVIAQFPERKSPEETYGVTLSANSNLAYVNDNIEQSNMSESKNDENGKSYYRENIAAASLSYNIPLNSPQEMVKLGINGRDTNDKIAAVGYYNVLNIPEAAFSRTRTVKFSLSLYRKNKDGIYEAVPIGEYLENITLYDKNGTAKAYSLDNDSYEFLFDKENELNFEAGSFEVRSSYSVKTGAEFENEDKIYSNYKVLLTAMLLDENGEPIENSGCSDHIIYTNAKIYSHMIAAG